MIAEYVIRAAGCPAALRADVRQVLVASVTPLPSTASRTLRSRIASSSTRQQLGEAYDIFV
jgi:hypothetical protein